MSFCEKYEFLAKKDILWIFAKLVFSGGKFQKKIVVHSGTFRYSTS